MGDCVQRYFAELSDSYRAVILLHDVEGMTNKEIADMLDISLDTAKIRLHRSRKQLRNILRDVCHFYIDERGVLICEPKHEKTPGDIATGVVHSVPEDLRKALISDSVALSHWEDITALARNEWICWVEDAKKPETRHRRIERVRTELKDGKRRPCCWAGCSHREKRSERK